MYMYTVVSKIHVYKLILLQFKYQYTCRSNINVHCTVVSLNCSAMAQLQATCIYFFYSKFSLPKKLFKKN